MNFLMRLILKLTYGFADDTNLHFKKKNEEADKALAQWDSRSD